MFDELDMFPVIQDKQPFSHIMPLIRDYMDEVADGISYTNPPCHFLGEPVNTLYVKGGMVIVKTKKVTVRLPVTTTLVNLNKE